MSQPPLLQMVEFCDTTTSDASTASTAVSVGTNLAIMQHVGRARSMCVGPGIFVCKCCDRQLPVSEISYRKSTCNSCSNAYKSLADRWSKHAS